MFSSVSLSRLDFLKVTPGAYYPRLGVIVGEGAEWVQGTLMAFQVQRFPSQTLPFFDQSLFACLFVCFLILKVVRNPVTCVINNLLLNC